MLLFFPNKAGQKQDRAHKVYRIDHKKYKLDHVSPNLHLHKLFVFDRIRKMDFI